MVSRVQNALETCTEEEAEQERPELKIKLMELAGDYLKKKKIDLDLVLEDKDELKTLAKIMSKASERMAIQANGDIEALRDEKVTDAFILCCDACVAQIMACK